jgi:subtilisin family serine protease
LVPAASADPGLVQVVGSGAAGSADETFSDYISRVAREIQIAKNLFVATTGLPLTDPSAPQGLEIIWVDVVRRYHEQIGIPETAGGGSELPLPALPPAPVTPIQTVPETPSPQTPLIDLGAGDVTHFVDPSDPDGLILSNSGNATPPVIDQPPPAIPNIDYVLRLAQESQAGLDWLAEISGRPIGTLPYMEVTWLDIVRQFYERFGSAPTGPVSPAEGAPTVSQAPTLERDLGDLATIDDETGAIVWNAGVVTPPIGASNPIFIRMGEDMPNDFIPDMPVEIVDLIDPQEPIEIVDLIGDSESFDLIGLNSYRQNSNFSGINGSGSVVVVIDTGADIDHSEFSGSGKIIYSYDFHGVNGLDDADANDTNGHGTHVAGIIAGNSANIGMASGAQLVIFKVTDESGGRTVYDAAVLQALQWVASNPLGLNIVAVNMSFGSQNVQSAANSANHSLLMQIKNAGIALVAASGNSYAGVAGVSSLSADPAVWSVGAVYDASVGAQSYNSGVADTTTSANQITAYSQRSTGLTDVFAPGSRIVSAWLSNQLGQTGGTSQAAPHVAGLVALMQDLSQELTGGKLSVDALLKLIRDGAVTIYDGVNANGLPNDPVENDNVTNTEAFYKRIDVLNTMNLLVEHFKQGRAATVDLNGNYVDGTQFFGWRGNDALTGRATNDAMTGNIGNDTLSGAAGDDTLNGGAGADSFDGGAGFDTASYANATASVQVVMYNTNYNTDEALGDVFTGIEALQGSASIDTLVGDFLANAISGGAGGDWIDGTYGGDSLYGEAGNDSLVSRAQADVLNGGADFDYARYDYADTGLNVFLHNASQNSGWALGDTLVSIEGIAGSYFNDNLQGNAVDNVIYGLGGADYIVGLGGNDILIGGDGADLFHYTSTADGGSGGDVIQDFGYGADRISVNGANFGLGSPGPGGAMIESWRFVAGTAATVASSQFIWNAPTGQLWYDQDGTGAGAQVLLATLQIGAAMTAGDILVL